MSQSADNRFQSAVNSHLDLHSPLPLVHITDAYSFVDILINSSIEPSECPVFKEQLTYLFYGRPSYQTKHSGSNYITANLPVAFIFDPNKINEASRDVYPFDTGAFYAGLYSNFFHRKSKIEHFRMPGSIESAQKIVSYFYQSNEEYFLGGSRKNVEIPPLNFEVEGVQELSRLTSNQQDDGTFKPDLRSSSVEMVYDKQIHLSDSLLGMIVPQACLDDDNIKSSINELKPKRISTYNGIHNIGSPSLLGILFQKTYDMYVEEGIFS